MSEVPNLSLLSGTPTDGGFRIERDEAGREAAIEHRINQISKTKNQPSYIEYIDQVPYAERGPDSLDYPTTPSLWNGTGPKKAWNDMWLRWTRAVHNRADRPGIAKNPRRGRYPRSGLSDEMERLFLSKGGPLARA